jgi:phage gp29-like protein
MDVGVESIRSDYSNFNDYAASLDVQDQNILSLMLANQMKYSKVELPSWKEGELNFNDPVATIYNDPDIIYSGFPYIENPDPIKQALQVPSHIPLYDNLSTDAHLSGIMQRVEAGLNRFEWHLKPGGTKRIDKTSLTYCKEVFSGFSLESKKRFLADDDDLTWQEIFNDHLQAIFYGYSIQEIIYFRDGKYIYPEKIVRVPRRRLAFSPEKKPVIRVISTNLVTPLKKLNYLLTRYRHTPDNPYGQGILTACYWPIRFKRVITEKGVRFCERLAGGQTIGFYEMGTPKQDREELLNNLSKLSNSTVGIAPKGVDIKVVESSSNGEAFLNFLEFFNKEISKAVLSATLGVDIQGSGSRAAAETHQESEAILSEAHRKIIANTMNKLLSYISYINLGEDAASPTFEFYEDSETSKDTVDIFDKARVFLPISKDHASDRLRIEVAKEDEEILPGYQGEWYQGEWKNEENEVPLQAIPTTEQATTEQPSNFQDNVQNPKQEPVQNKEAPNNQPVQQNEQGSNASPPDTQKFSHPSSCECCLPEVHLFKAVESWQDTLGEDPISQIKLRSAKSFSKLLGDDYKEISKLIDDAFTPDRLLKSLNSFYKTSREEQTKIVYESMMLSWLLGYYEEVENAKNDSVHKFASVNSDPSTWEWTTVPFQEAIDYLIEKVDLPTEQYQKVSTDLQGTSFYVTGLNRADALADIHDALNETLQSGGNIGDFKKKFIEISQKVGFEPKDGLARRSEIVFENNIHSAFNAGAMTRMREMQDVRPYATLLNSGGRSCPSCQMVRGVTMSVSEWNVRGTPLFHHRCRCQLVSQSKRQVELRKITLFDMDKDFLTYTNEKGESRKVSLRESYTWKNPSTGQTETIPFGVSPGFNYMKGGDLDYMQKIAQQKLITYPPSLSIVVGSDLSSQK